MLRAQGHVPGLPSSHRALVVTALSAALVAVLAACPDSGGPGLRPGDAQGGVDLVGPPPDVAFDLATGPDLDGVPDAGVEDAGDDAGPDGTADAADVATGTVGAACESADDCNDGWCLPTRDGGVCSRACTTTCPDGWQCRQNVGILPDIAFVCMPPAPTFCRPCRENADCLSPVDAAPHACVPVGDAGAFCGAACETDADCPAEAACAAVTDIRGDATRQCMPRSGECTCGDADAAAGYSTVCHVGTPAGRCPGTRGCTEGGALSACDAPPPSTDLCNGLDDNCDGEVDEAFLSAECENANEVGTCPGVTVCVEGEERCDGPVPAVESCNDEDDDCDGMTDPEGAAGCTVYFLDIDGDGFGVGEGRCLCAPDGDYRAEVGGDCDDEARAVNPDAVERCNRRDDDCDETVDEEDAVGCSTFHRDQDRDGFGDPDITACLCAPEAPFDTRSATDCDDGDDSRSPAEVERCNLVDDDCDGETDGEGSVGCALWFADVDEDDFGDPASFRCLCGPADAFVASVGGDCDDLDPDVQPAAPEQCGGVDEDCDGVRDEEGAIGCEAWLRDGDGDGLGVAGDVRCLCAAEDPWDTKEGGDCDDRNATSAPGLEEVCDEVDNDCDGVVDEPGAEGCTVYYQDRDADGRGISTASACLCAPRFPYTVETTDDCDDSNPFVNPSAPEVCNGIDDDCDEDIDEEVTGQCTSFYRDRDGDGWGDPSESRCLCAPDEEFTTTRGGDCRDDRPDVYPLADEICDGAGVDEDCDDAVDEEDALGCENWLLDADEDGFGVAGQGRCLCAPSGDFRASEGGDCDDTRADVSPAAIEACNDVDDDCDGQTDERGATGCSEWLRDTDGDGYGLALDAQCLCEATGVYRAQLGGECNDLDGAVNPGAEEICNQIDDDCNGVADDPGVDGCSIYYRDIDGDTWGDGRAESCLCRATGLFTAGRAGDCDDLAATVNPVATERCNDRDDDCDSATDEAGALGCTPWLEDGDGDGFGVTGSSQCLCEADAPFVGVIGGDCADDDEDVFPGQLEICNGVDDNCDDRSDPDGASGCLIRYADEDRDGFGASERQRCVCAAEEPWDAEVGGDCDDSNDAVAPGETETCNGLDDDCDGSVDEEGASGCTSYYLDADGDGVGVDGQTRCLCAAVGAWSATVAGDCDDGDAARTPGKSERCGGVDEDCDGTEDEPGAIGCATYWQDEDGDTYGLDGSESCRCAAEPGYDAVRGGDCDDARGDINADAAEVCDAVDNDCDEVVDESECGLPTTNWPTFMHNARRTGHPFGFQGPIASGTQLRWKRQLTTALPFDGSPIIAEDGQVVALIGGQLFKLAVDDGAILWTLQLPAPAAPRTSPTARVGGTLVVPTGHGLALVSPAGELIWHVDFGGDPADVVTGSPIVDQNGIIYAASTTHVRALGPAGEILWETPFVGAAGVASDVAIGPDGRLYVTGAQEVYGMTRDGIVNWTWCPASGGGCDATRRPLASVTINEVGRILAPMGHVLYQLADGLTEALVDRTATFTNSGGAPARIGSSVAVFSTGYECCNPAEYPLVTPAGPNGVRMLNTNLSTHFQAAVEKAAAPHGAGILDRDGDIFVGSNATEANGTATFSARRRRSDGSRGQAWWTASVDGRDIDGAPALGVVGTTPVVLVGDSSGTIYCFGR